MKLDAKVASAIQRAGKPECRYAKKAPLFQRKSGLPASEAVNTKKSKGDCEGDAAEACGVNHEEGHSELVQKLKEEIKVLREEVCTLKARAAAAEASWSRRQSHNRNPSGSTKSTPACTSCGLPKTRNSAKWYLDQKSGRAWGALCKSCKLKAVSQHQARRTQAKRAAAAIPDVD